MFSPYCNKLGKEDELNTGVYRSKLPNGAEVAYVDKGQGKTIGVLRDRYIEQGYTPAFEELPEK